MIVFLELQGRQLMNLSLRNEQNGWLVEADDITFNIQCEERPPQLRLNLYGIIANQMNIVSQIQNSLDNEDCFNASHNDSVISSIHNRRYIISN